MQDTNTDVHAHIHKDRRTTYQKPVRLNHAKKINFLKNLYINSYLLYTTLQKGNMENACGYD